MIKITISINGKEVNSSNQMKEAMNNAIASKLKEMITKKLSHLRSEMQKQAAKIDVDMNNGKVLISNVPEELKQKIIQALR